MTRDDGKASRPLRGWLARVRHNVQERPGDARWNAVVATMTALDAPAIPDGGAWGLDGCMGYAASVMTPHRRGVFTAWNPDDATPQGHYWEAMIGLARQTLLDERRQIALDLIGGDAITLIEGTTPIVRVGRTLTDRSLARLQSIFDGLVADVAVVNLRPLAAYGGPHERLAAVRVPAGILWVVNPDQRAPLPTNVDPARCLDSLDEAHERLHAVIL